KNEGVVLDAKSNQIAWANGNLWAPAAIEVKQKDGSYKYFLYYSANPIEKGGKQIGVAVSDSPVGPFLDFGKPIVSKSPVGHGQQIDVDVFIDPVSKKPYLYWGNGYMAGAELEPSMTAIKENTIQVMTPKGGSLKDYAYREAPYVFYRNGLYYFMWSVDDTGAANYHVAYGTSKSPLGPIEVAKDPIVLIQDPQHEIYGTAHNSVIQKPGKDEWYIVYHRINKDYLHNQPGVHREVCIDKMEFNADGTIKRVVPTHNGVAGDK
ncbi:MAG TPA: glycoside hydrolase, partial [Prevotella sp.]|nr:glycoside hydrolase [Candidatus Segatella violae]